MTDGRTELVINPADNVKRRGMSLACNDFNSSLYTKKKN